MTKGSSSGGLHHLSVLLVTAFVNASALGMVLSLIPFYAIRLNGNTGTGWTTSVFLIAQLVSAPFWGRLSDRRGRRLPYLAGMGISAIAFAGFGLTANVWMLFLSLSLQGIGIGTFGVLRAYVADMTEPKDRARGLGWLVLAVLPGTTIGFPLGSLAFGLGTAAPGLLAAALVLLNFGFAFRRLPDSHLPKEQLQRHVSRSIRDVIVDMLFAPRGKITRLVWIYCGGTLGLMAMSEVLALNLEVGSGATDQTIFPIYAAVISVAMLAVVLGRLVDWLGEIRVMQLGAGLLVLALVSILLPRWLAPSWLILSMMPIARACFFLVVTALVTHGTRREEWGLILGILGAISGGVAQFIALVLETTGSEGLGYAIPFSVAATTLALVMVLVFRVRAAPVGGEASGSS